MKKILIALGILVVAVAGIWLYSRSIFSDEPIASDTVSPSPEANIVVTSPEAGDKVGNPITVTGKARVFESQFNYALKDSAGNKLYEGYAMSEAQDMGLYGNFTIKIPVPIGAPKTLYVEVFDYSAKDGSVIDLVTVPVEFNAVGTTTVKVYFINNRLDPEITCVKTFPVEREVPKTQEPAYISLVELLKGPTASEKQSDYSSVIPQGVKINSLIVRNGIAYADFDATLEFEVGGSCRVAAIRWEITNTLKQFSTIRNVVISINGRTEDILQP